MTSTSLAEYPKNISRFRAHWEPLEPKFFEISAKYDSFNIRLRTCMALFCRSGQLSVRIR